MEMFQKRKSKGIFALILRISFHSTADEQRLTDNIMMAAKLPSAVQKQPPEVFCKSAVFKNFAIFSRKHLRWSLFLIKLKAYTLFL